MRIILKNSCKIIKSAETMSARRRVINTFAFEKTDRVTIGYDANPGIHRRLKEALGINAGGDEALLETLGVDYREIGAPYTGPKLFTAPGNRGVHELEGSLTRWIEHETGGYWDFCGFPLANAEDEDFYAFPVPDPDCFDYEAALAKAKSCGGEYALYIGNAGIPDVINSNSRIMGMENLLCHLITRTPAVMGLLGRRAAFQLGMFERLLDKCEGYIDFVWLGEDLGTQIAPMISLDLYRETLKPVHKKFADLASAYKLPVMIHTCGCSSWAYEDMINIGIKGVDSLQPEAKDMSPGYLTEHFGGRLNFRGLISTTGALSFGTPDDVTKLCVDTLDIMKPHGGYHFAPSHAIQDNTPVGNVAAMYQAAHDFGKY
jgi:uroporphyrinogen decarboxylase